MAKKGLTTEKVIEREKVAYSMFKKKPDLSAKEVRSALKKEHKFGMRLARLYELKRMAGAGDEYQPKGRKPRGKERPVTSIQARHPAPQQAARRGHKVASPDQHPAVAEATKILEGAGFKNITIDGVMPVLVPFHYKQPAA